MTCIKKKPTLKTVYKQGVASPRRCEKQNKYLLKKIPPTNQGFASLLLRGTKQEAVA